MAPIPGQSETLGANLPLQLTSFIGREHEIAEVKRLLATTRLLTLTGAGGCGKTRLALRAAEGLLDEYPDGVWFVDLAPLTEPALVPQTVASIFDLRESAEAPVGNVLENYLRTKNLLLVLDNCEHLIEACAQLSDTLLRACPNLKILATSRETLNIAGETTLGVPPLSLPDPKQLPTIEALKQFESIQLFAARAGATEPHFQLTNSNAPAIAQICQRLDGMPLAIELAAARVKSIGVEQIAARLDDRFRLLTRGSRTALPRQQTLRATIDWSHDLLPEQERILFRRLSVFAGGWTLPAAEQVTGQDGISPNEVLDLLTRLADKSLVIIEEQSGQARYHLLETIRQYAREKLDTAGENQTVRNRHLDYFLKFAEDARQFAWLDRHDVEHDNLHTALEWSLSEGRVEKGLRLAAALDQFWQIRGYVSQGRAWLQSLLSKSGDALASVRAKALHSAGFLSLTVEDIEQGTAFFESSLALYRELRDTSGIASQLVFLGRMAGFQGDYARARTLAEQGLTLHRELGNKWGASVALFFLAEFAYLQDDHAQAMALLEESVALCREIGNMWAVGRRLTRLGQAAHAQGNSERALALIKEGLVACRQAKDYPGIAWSLTASAGIARVQGELVWATRLLGAVEALREVRGAGLSPFYRVDYERNVAELRTLLDQATYAKVWAEGRAMTMEQAIDYALKGVPGTEPRPEGKPSVSYPAGLTEREVEVLRWLALGLSNQEIADKLVLSKRTIHAHLRSIYSKLDVTTRSAATRVAIDNKLV